MKNIFLIFVFLISTSLWSKTILFVGDSLTEGYGVDQKDRYTSIIERELNKGSVNKVVVLNGSVSGSTSASGKSRVKWFKSKNPEILVLALGANDGLRGIALQETKKNLEEIIVYAKSLKMNVLLAGMMLPPNYGEEYRNGFKNMYKDLISKHKLKSMPFLLEGVAGEKELNQDDGIHPNEKGHIIMANKMLPYLREML